MFYKLFGVIFLLIITTISWVTFVSDPRTQIKEQEKQIIRKCKLKYENIVSQSWATIFIEIPIENNKIMCIICIANFGCSQLPEIEN